MIIRGVYMIIRGVVYINSILVIIIEMIIRGVVT